MQWTAGIVKRILPNGLTLLVQRDHSAPVVAVVTHVRAGYFDEPDECVGIAHVLEHMYFKGTHRRGPGAIAREIQLIGGYINAATSYDKTVYYTVLPSGQQGLEKAVEVQADALTDAAVNRGELTRELEVVIQEAKRKLDTPAAVATESLYALLFTVHRMRRWRIGSEPGLRRLTRDDVQAYYVTRYTPDRVIIALVGELDVSHAVDVATAAYGQWGRSSSVIEGSPPEPDGVHPAARVLGGDVQRPLAVVGWRTVGTLHDDTPALDAAAAVLGAGRGSRLYRRLRLSGLASHAQASHYTPTEVGVFGLTVESEEDRLDMAVEEALGLVASLRTAPPTDEELVRIRSLVASQWARRFESMDGRAAVLCESQALGDVHLADEFYRRALEVTGAEVQRAAERYLGGDRASVVFSLPNGTSTSLPDRWPLAASGGAAYERAGSLHVSPVVRPRPAGLDSKEYPGRISRRSYAGADVLVRPKRGSGLTTVGVHFPGVTCEETADLAGASLLFGRTALRGVSGMTAEELAEAVERLGGAIAPGLTPDTLGWWVTVRPDAVREAAHLLRRVALEPTLSAQDVTVERNLQASDARRVRDDMFSYPIQRVLAHAFPSDAYGLPALGEPEVVAALTDSTVRSWGERVRTQRAVVVAVGDLEPDQMFDSLEALSSWPAPPPAGHIDGPAVSVAAGRGDERRGKVQTALAMAFPAHAFGSRERYPLVVLSALLSGLAGRLHEELRGRRSLAYTVAAIPWLAVRGGAMLTYVATSPDREEEARGAMLAELQRVCAEPPSAEELARARNYAAGMVEVRQQSGRAIAGEMLEAWVSGDLEGLGATAARLRAVSMHDVVRMAEQVFREEGRAEYVVRGKRTA